MKKYTIITLTLLFIILISPVIGRADEGSSSKSGSSKLHFGTKKEVRERMEDRRERELLERKIETGVLPSSVNIEERRKERLEEMNENGNKYGIVKQIAKKAYIINFKLEHLMKRFQTRIDKLKERGVDVSKADAQMAVVKNAYEDAKIKIEALKTLRVDHDTESDDDSSNEADVSAIEKAREEIREAIKTVHEEMKELLSILKSYRVEDSTKTPGSVSTNTE